jgi:hypothetical protein
MASTRSAAQENVRLYRAKMKQQGFRQVSIWVPDTKSPKFRKECRRQSQPLDLLRERNFEQAGIYVRFLLSTYREECS